MLVLSEAVVKMPKGVDVEGIKRRIGNTLDFASSDEFDKFIEHPREYGLLCLQEEGLREFLEDDPDIYAGNGIKM